VDAQANAPAAPEITFIESKVNLGFAGGVNQGLACLARNAAVDRFWVLNPDSVSPPQTPRIFATQPVPETGFSLMGGRVAYLNPPDRIQLDGGLISYRTGVTRSANHRAKVDEAQLPKAEDIDFISGASMVASREFYETIGPMPEQYFLYYEEVDWAVRRKDLPLVQCPDAVVHHRVGSSIGSSGFGKIATPFSTYFLYRARMMFLCRYTRLGVMGCWAHAGAKAAVLFAKGYRGQARAILRGVWDGMTRSKPPAYIREQLGPEALAVVFGPAKTA
jgi:GT2 family glycosyltransferase